MRSPVLTHRIVRTLAAALVGLVAAASLPHDALRVATGVAGASDYIGVIVGLAGVVLIVLAFREALRGRRLAIKLLIAIPVGLALLQWYVLPVTLAGLVTNTSHPHIAGATTLGLPGARDMAFPAGDGTP
jgi:hypothetical protein